MRVPQVVLKAEELRNKEGKLKEALELLREYEKTSSKQDLPFVQYSIGLLLHDLGKFQESIVTFKQAVKTAQKVRNKYIEADSLRRIGWGLWMIDNSDPKSLEYLEKSWGIAENNLKDKDFQKIGANIWAARGAACYESEKYEDALNSYQKAMELARKCEFNERVCTLKGDIANVYIGQGEYVKARKELEDSYEYAKSNYRHSVPSSLIRLARLFSLDEYLEKNLDKSEEFLNKALDVVKLEGWRRDEAEVYDGLYHLYKKMDNNKLAEEQKKKAIEIYSELGMKHRIRNLERSN